MYMYICRHMYYMYMYTNFVSTCTCTYIVCTCTYVCTCNTISVLSVGSPVFHINLQSTRRQKLQLLSIKCLQQTQWHHLHVCTAQTVLSIFLIYVHIQCTVYLLTFHENSHSFYTYMYIYTCIATHFTHS